MIDLVLKDTRQPALCLAQGLRLEAVDPPLGLAPGVDDAGLPQHAQVLRDRGAAGWEVARQVADRALFLSEQFDDPAPGRVG